MCQVGDSEERWGAVLTPPLWPAGASGVGMGMVSASGADLASLWLVLAIVRELTAGRLPFVTPAECRAGCRSFPVEISERASSCGPRVRCGAMVRDDEAQCTIRK